MRLGVDARPLMEKKSGIGTYLDAMLSELLELSRELELYLISDGEICFPEHPRARKIRYKGFRFLPNTLYFEFLLPRFLRKDGGNCSGCLLGDAAVYASGTSEGMPEDSHGA